MKDNSGLDELSQSLFAMRRILLLLGLVVSHILLLLLLQL